MTLIYLDHAASTSLHPDVATSMVNAFRAGYVNPASQHSEGRRARAALDVARDDMLELLGARSDVQLILTSGGTEANNLVLAGLAGHPPGRIVVSSIEHPSILESAACLVSRGFDVQLIPVDASGAIDLDAALELLTPDTRVVSVMFGNHETGVLQPISALAEQCRAMNVAMHVDAVQAVGKVPIDFSDLGVAAMTVAPHKFHGPRGVGALLVAPHVSMQPSLVGGAQQFGLRPGTEDVALAIGFATALRIAAESLASAPCAIANVRDAFEDRLRSLLPSCEINGAPARRLPHISNIAFPGLSREALLINLDLLGVACSTGSACASGSSEPSPVLVAMGIDEAHVQGSLRFSFGIDSDPTECDRAVELILKSVNNLRVGFSPG